MIYIVKMSERFIKSYNESPTMNNLYSLIQCICDTEYIAVSWDIDNNYWYVPCIFNKNIYTNDFKGWYLPTFINADNLPIDYNSKLFELSTPKIKLLTDKIIHTDCIFYIKVYLEKLYYDDMVKRYKFKQTLSISNISHSIRTPLNGILHMTKSIIDAKNTNSSIDESVKYLNISAVTLANNIIDIIDMSKLESGSLTISKEVFNIRETVKSALDYIESSIVNLHTCKIDYYIDISVPQYIYSDRTRIKQILINLLENALQNTINGDIFVHVSANIINLASENNAVIKCVDYQYLISFIVQDTGNGLDEITANNLFNPAELNSNSEQKCLSLRMSYLLSKVLNGNLKLLSSKIKVGSCFEFSILVYNEQYPEITNKHKCTNEHLLNILVVEDEYINRIVIKKLLKKMGFNIIMASSGEEALKLYNSDIDVCLIDIRMPNMTGFELADKIYALNNNAKMIGVTAQMIIEDNIKPWFSEFVYKPIQSDELYKKILTLCQFYP